MNRLRQESIAQALDSGAVSDFIDSLLARVEEWNMALLNDVDLAPDTRRGYVLARREILAGLQTLYENAGRQMPPRLQKEFGNI